ncbi:MAG: hypothetical protein WC548_02990 [Candidatus Pacearchaeota archaeon]
MIRKIKNQNDIKKAKRRNQIILGIILIFILVGSMLLVDKAGDSKDESKTTENGVEFYNINDVWQTQIGQQVFAFSYLPSELDIEAKGVFSIADYYSKPIYFNDLNNEGAIEILMNIGNFIQRYQEACETENCEKNLPTKTCEDIFFIFKEGENSSVYKKDNCVYITGDSKKGADAFLYKALNI